MHSGREQGYQSGNFRRFFFPNNFAGRFTHTEVSKSRHALSVDCPALETKLADIKKVKVFVTLRAIAAIGNQKAAMKTKFTK